MWARLGPFDLALTTAGKQPPDVNCRRASETRAKPQCMPSGSPSPRLPVKRAMLTNRHPPATCARACRPTPLDWPCQKRVGRLRVVVSPPALIVRSRSGVRPQHRLTDRSSDTATRDAPPTRWPTDDGYANLLMVGPIGRHNARRRECIRRRRGGRIKRTSDGAGRADCIDAAYLCVGRKTSRPAGRERERERGTAKCDDCDLLEC